MRQKTACPLCKSDCNAQQLVALQYQPRQRLTEFQQQFLAAESSSSSPSAACSSPASLPKPSPLTLPLRLQSLTAQLDAASLERTQRTEARAQLTSRTAHVVAAVAELEATHAHYTSELSSLTDELTRLRSSLATATQSHRLLQQRRRTLHRQLLVIRCITTVRRTWQEGAHVDLDALLRTEERRMPYSSPPVDAEPSTREEAMDLLMRVLIGEVQAEVESVKRAYKEQVQDKERDTGDLRREHARHTADIDRLIEQKRALIQERAALERRRLQGRGRRKREGEDGHVAAPASLTKAKSEGRDVVHEKKRRSVSDGLTSRAERSGEKEDEAIVVSD